MVKPCMILNCLVTTGLVHTIFYILWLQVNVIRNVCAVWRHAGRLFIFLSFQLLFILVCTSRVWLNYQYFSGITTLCLYTQTSLSPFFFIFLSFINFIIAFLKQKFIFCNQQMLFFFLIHLIKTVYSLCCQYTADLLGAGSGLALIKTNKVGKKVQGQSACWQQRLK